VDAQDEPSTRTGEHLPADDRRGDEPVEPDDAAAGDGRDASTEHSTEQLPRRDRWRAAAGRLQDRLQDRFDAQRYSFVPSAEVVAIDARRHPLVLVLPVLRTVAGLALMVLGPLLVPLAWFALVTAVWAQVRMAGGLRRSAVVGGSAAAAVVVLLALDGREWDLLLLLLLLLWLAEDLADWYSDRLVVTDKRIYRRHGVITRHSPSISLMAIAYIDAAVPPLGQLLHYGTLRLDSVAQRDAPLSRFDLIPDVVPVSHEILRLRAAAMPKGPPQVF
jgi:hypothetical protein